jgi:hypothetical protein
MALKQIKRLRDKNSEYSVLIRSTLSILIGIMVTIATVSSIGAVSLLYWTMLGLCVASCEITKNALLRQNLK